MLRLRTWSLVMLAAGGIGLAACSSPSSTAVTPPTSTSPTTSPTSAASSTTTGAAIAPVVNPSPAGTFGTKPTVTIPPGPPPTQLESTDLIVGTGATAVTGDTVTVQYVGVAYSSGKQFDASWDRGQSFTFTLGGQVIPG